MPAFYSSLLSQPFAISLLIQSESPARIKKPTSTFSALPSKASLLDFSEGFGAAENRYHADNTSDRKGLEEIPARVVEEENEFHRDD